MSESRFARVPSQIVGGFSQDSVDKICPDRTINMYPVFSQTAKNQAFLAPWPGLKKIGTIGNGIIRSATVALNKNFVVSGRAFYYLDSAFVPQALSGDIIGTATGYVSSAATLNEIAFCDGVNAFYYNGSSVVPMPIPGGVIPSQVCAFDNYVVLFDKQTDKFYVSAQNDLSTWDPTNFARITSVSTQSVAGIRLKRRLFVFGRQVAEVWVNVGASRFPFRRDNNIMIEHGIESIGSIAQGFDLAFYLSRDQDGVGAVMMLDGVQPMPISTRELDYQIQSFAVTSDATGSVYKINGQIFYQINFTSENRTFVYNVNQRTWHELMMLDRSRYAVQNHTFFQEKHLMYAYNANSFFELNEKFFDNDGDPILRERIYRVISSPNYEKIKLHRFNLDVLQGVGNLSQKIMINNEPFDTQETDPRISLALSKDGGETFKDYGFRSLGRIGERLHRTFWLNLGERRDHIAKLTFISKVPFYVLGASIDYTLEQQ